MLLTSPVPTEEERKEGFDFFDWTCEWNKEVEITARKEFKVWNLVGDVVDKKARGHLGRKDLKVVMFCGHGSPEGAIHGQNEDIIIAGENDNLLNSKIVYSLSCFSSKVGEKAVDKKIHRNPCESFIGYKRDIFLWYEKNHNKTSLEGEIAEIYKQLFYGVTFSLLNGNSAKTSVKKVRDELLENLQKKKEVLEAASPHGISLERSLLWNAHCLDIYGNQNAKLKNIC